MKKVKNNVKKLLNSYHTVLTILIIVCLISMFVSYRVMSLSNTFMFNGTNDYVKILNGVISTNYNVNLFVGSDIEYTLDKDIIINEYSIGYYTMQNNEYIKLAVIEGKDEVSLSLKKLLSSKSAFNLTEPTKNNHYFNKDTIKALKEDNLYFIIEVNTLDEEQIKEVLKIDLEQISK